MPGRPKRHEKAKAEAGAWLKAIQEKLFASAEAFRDSLNKKIAEITASVGLNYSADNPEEISKDNYKNYINGFTTIPLIVKYAAKLIENNCGNVINPENISNKSKRLALNVFDEHIDGAELRRLFEMHKGSYICLFFVRRLMTIQNRQVPSLYIIHYDINDCDEEDGTLIAKFTTEQGAHPNWPQRGYAKLVIGKSEPSLIYFLNVEHRRTQPPVSGLIHASQVIKTGASFFYGIASGSQSELTDTFIAVRVLWIPCITQRIKQLPHQITEEHIGKPAWDSLMRYWMHKEPLEDVYLLAPSMLHGLDGKASMSVRDVVQDFIDLMGDEPP